MLPFDFVEEEANARAAAFERTRFDEPKNDNERLLGLQYKFKKFGDGNALAEFSELAKTVAMKFIAVEARRNKFIKALSRDERLCKADDAVMTVVERLLTDKEFFIEKNAPGYLYLQVLKALYYRNKSDSIVEFCDGERLEKYINAGYRRVFE